jgi:hypothetical protein
MNAAAKALIVFFLLLAVNSPCIVSAVSYQPPVFHRQKHETFVKGDIVYLFHSGTADVKQTVHGNDVLVVYRIDSSCDAAEVGKIRVVSYIGETYLKGEVIEGKIERDDIARKDSVSCLVISAGLCDRRPQ